MFAFDFSENYVLEDDFVLLRPLEWTDYDFLNPFSLDEPTLWKFSNQQANGENNLRKYFATALTAREQRREYPFIVFDKTQQKYAGSTRFYDIQLAQKTLQLGYTWYGKAHQGTGLNKHCKYLLLHFAFEKMQMERVEFRADALNERSIAAMKSIGCTAEGILRSNTTKPEGGRRDSIILSILKNEWAEQVKENLKKKLLHVK